MEENNIPLFHTCFIACICLHLQFHYMTKGGTVYSWDDTDMNEPHLKFLSSSDVLKKKFSDCMF